MVGTEKILETIIAEKEMTEFNLRGEIMQWRSDLGRKDEEANRVKKNYDALRHEFRTLKEENESILEENRKLKQEVDKLKMVDKDHYSDFL